MACVCPFSQPRVSNIWGKRVYVHKSVFTVVLSTMSKQILTRAYAVFGTLSHAKVTPSLQDGAPWLYNVKGASSCGFQYVKEA